jgi:V/A-type H+-transporting ATPase subunit G/H
LIGSLCIRERAEGERAVHRARANAVSEVPTFRVLVSERGEREQGAAPPRPSQVVAGPAVGATERSANEDARKKCVRNYQIAAWRKHGKMVRPEVLDRIQSAEHEAEEIREEARSDRDQRISDAREHAEEIREEARQEANELEEQRMDDAREDIEAEREEVLSEGKAERERLISRARERREGVVSYVVDRFTEEVRGINAQT